MGMKGDAVTTGVPISDADNRACKYYNYGKMQKCDGGLDD